MGSSNQGGGVYVLRVVCPNGDEVEADRDAYAGREAARRGADELAALLGGEAEFGLPPVAEDAAEGVQLLGFLPRDCRVRVWDLRALVCVYEVAVGDESRAAVV
jgi:hypothetical protein